MWTTFHPIFLDSLTLCTRLWIVQAGEFPHSLVLPVQGQEADSVSHFKVGLKIFLFEKRLESVIVLLKIIILIGNYLI